MPASGTASRPPPSRSSGDRLEHGVEHAEAGVVHGVAVLARLQHTRALRRERVGHRRVELMRLARATLLHDQRAAGRDVRARALDDGGDDGTPVREQAPHHRGERLVVARRLQRLQEDANQTIAADAQSEELVGLAAHVVGHRHRHVALDHRARALGEIALEAAAAHQPLIVAVGGDQDAVAGLAVRRADGVEDAREDHGLALRAPGFEGPDDLTLAHIGSASERCI
ncbi:MAG: hypothetical protein M5U08_15600 [Burkholderiales bacterium]|nr:hypothetical protein [Burkholderiales bacterium]